MHMNVRGFSAIPENIRPIVGGGLIVVGAILAFLGRKKKKDEKK
jgi:LPXTG-motif cell wall-anchored protein